VLWVVIGVAAFVVVALAVLAPTVIAGDNHGHARSVRVMAPAAGPAPAPFPFRRGGRLPDLRACLQRHGIIGQGQQTPPSLDKLRGALKDCGAPFLR